MEFEKLLWVILAIVKCQKPSNNLIITNNGDAFIVFTRS